MSRDISRQSREFFTRGSVMDVRARPTRPALDRVPIRTDLGEQSLQLNTEAQTQPKKFTLQSANLSNITPEHHVEADIVSSQPVVSQPPSEHTESPAKGLSPELLAQAESVAKQQEQDTQRLLEARAKNKRKKPFIAIFLAIITGLSLIGLTVYAYLSSQQKITTNQGHSSQEKKVEQNKAPVATPIADISAVEQEIDAIINASDEATEIPATGLDEQSIGL